MAKIYDIVETSKMSAEYDGSKIFSTYRANGALENGRLVTISSGEVVYATEGVKGIYLHASQEVMPDTSKGLTYFRKEDGELVRMYQIEKGDEFGTTAYDGVAVAGDSVILDVTGKLKKGTPAGTESFIGEVIAVKTLGYDLTSAIVVRAKQAL